MRPERRGGDGVRLGAWVPLALALLAGCGGAWGASGRVTECRTGAPLVGVKLTLTRGDDVAETTTDPEGRFDLAVNAPPEGAATLVLAKPTWTSRTERFEEPPDEDLSLCLSAP